MNEGKLKPEQMTEKFFDYIFLDKGEAAGVAGDTGISAELLNEIRSDVEYWYPLDINLGGKEHMTVHFPVFLMNHVAILPEKYHPRGILSHWYIVGKGSKISKSKGGAVPIPNAAGKFTVDALRLYYCHVASPFADVEWDEATVGNYRQRISRVESLIRQLEDVDGKYGIIDDWLVSRFNTRLKQIYRGMDSFDLRIAANEIFFEIPSDLRWYLKRGGGSKETLDYVLNTWIKLICPFTPHIAEEVWESRGGEGLVSGASLPEPDSMKINEKAEVGEIMLKNLMDDMDEIIKVTAITPKKIVIYTAEDWKAATYRDALQTEKVDVPGIMKKLMADEEIRSKGKAVSKYVQKLAGESRKMKPEDRKRYSITIDEKSYIGGAVDFLKEQFDCDIEVYRAGEECYDPQNKAQRAEPWKPAIFIE